MGEECLLCRAQSEKVTGKQGLLIIIKSLKGLVVLVFKNTASFQMLSNQGRNFHGNEPCSHY